MMVGLYVDDLIFVGEIEEIMSQVEIVKKRIEIRMITNFKEFIGWELIIKDEFVVMNQMKLTKKLINDFKKEISNMKWNQVQWVN